MSRPVSDYVALAFIGKVGDPHDIFGSMGDREFQGNWAELKGEAETRCGFELSERVLRDAVRALAQCGLVRVSEDRYAGEFVKIYPARFPDFIRKAETEASKAIENNDEVALLSRPSDYPNASALAQHAVFEDYSELGDEWLRRALAGLKASVEEAGSLTEYEGGATALEAPASDRTVHFSDNEVKDFELKTSEVIEGVEALNSIGEQAGLRDLILGQLRAGRELIRAGCVKAYLLQITLVDTLHFLAKRYEHDAIGALASALAIALAKHLGLEV